MQGAKFKREKKLAHRLLVPCLQAKVCRVEIEPHIVEQAAKLFVDPNLVRVFLNCVAQFRR